MGAILNILKGFLPASLRFLKGLVSLGGRISGALTALVKKGGIIGSVASVLRKIWNWVANQWISVAVFIASAMDFLFNKLRAVIGTAFIGATLVKILQFLIKFILKKPVFIVLFLFLSSWFPTILETWFRLVGAVVLRLAIPFISAMMKQLREMSESYVNDYENALSSAMSELPNCIGAHLSFFNVQGCVGMITTAFMLCITYRLVAMAYGFYFKTRR